MVIRCSDGGSVVFWSKRVGKNNKIFKMPKFRTMKLSTPQVATHLLEDPDQYLIRFGKLLRKTSLDEIPQLYCILKGDMSFVGPRPALFNQDDLVKLRTDKKVHSLTPGLTGWAQVNGRDDVSIEDKVKLDVEYLQKRGMLFDLEILGKTLWQVVRRKGVSH
jgi:O-antigen biosynthesis protein WbqP